MSILASEEAPLRRLVARIHRRQSGECRFAAAYLAIWPGADVSRETLRARVGVAHKTRASGAIDQARARGRMAHPAGTVSSPLSLPDEAVAWDTSPTTGYVPTPRR